MVNPSSVIPTWLNFYNPAAYVSLTDKENWSYTNQGVGIWQPLYQSLANALNAYQAFNRSAEIQTFFFNTYGYVIFNKIYGTDGSLIGYMDGLNAYGANGFMYYTTTRPINFYNDYVIDPGTGLGGSANMANDTAAVQAANAAETANLATVASNAHGTIQAFQFNLLFEDKAVTGNAPKSYMKNLYFANLHWTQVFNSLNVGGLPIPT